MDERTSLLICLGASAAANCIPCFEHYNKKSSAAGLTREEILEAVELAYKVKNGAHLLMRSSINGFFGQQSQAPICDCDRPKSCCGE